MGNGLSKEQEQCFRLIQQLFKAADVSQIRDLEIWKYGEKQGRDASIIRKA